MRSVEEPLPISALSGENAAECDDGTVRLCRALVAGDESSWSTFYDGYHRRLRGYLRVVWKGPDEVVDDLLQETFLRAVRYMRVFPDEASLWSWLTVLARSATADAGRKRSRLKGFLDRLLGESSAGMPGAGLGLEAAISRLPEASAKLLRMKYEDGCSVREIASELELSEKAVESRLTRARRCLKKELDRKS